MRAPDSEKCRGCVWGGVGGWGVRERGMGVEAQIVREVGERGCSEPGGRMA